tara:strand:+ start:48 stop:1004 length:957 start_codon:yes stop_codon:yes gene_type:complete
MKKVLTFIFFLLISFCFYAQSPVYKLYYDNGNIKKECAYIDDATGKIYAEYADGRSIHGNCKFYYENGNLQREGKYVRGVPAAGGIFKEYRENGLLYQIDLYGERGKKLLSRTYCDGIYLMMDSYRVGDMTVTKSYLCSDRNLNYGSRSIYKPAGTIDWIGFYNHKTNENKGIYEDVNFITYDLKGNVLKNMKTMSHYDLKEMINFFLQDAILWGIKINNNQNIKATFEQLDGNTIALALGKNYDNDIVIKVDPENWQNSSAAKRWYILYHELGHDVLNLDHGEGGKMMFNFVDQDYTWDDLSKDKARLFALYLENYN